MSTLQAPCRCPRCHHPEATLELDCRTDNESVFCDRCGYTHVLAFGTLERNGGYGVFRIKRANGFGMVGAFRSRKRWSDRIAQLRRNLLSPKVTFVALTVQVRGRWQDRVLKDEPRWRPPRPRRTIYLDLDLEEIPL